MNSLDPRVTRLPEIEKTSESFTKEPLDQLATFEVFVQPKVDKPFQHEGIVHATNVELAYVFAKEAFTRRFTCSSLYVAETTQVCVSPLTEGTENAYHFVTEPPTSSQGINEKYEIYHLIKRGKQHVHVGTVEANSPHGALWQARKLFGDKQVYNVWAIPTKAIRFTSPEEQDLWKTLPEKKFRDAAEYKGGDKLKTFLEKQTNTL
ncbi:MAG: phenylacetic acid degradation b [Bacteroidota bacterium]